jgi:hypothetical protein
MKFSFQSRIGVVMAAVSVAFLGQGALAQEAPAKEAQSREAKGMPPRAAPADYQAHAQAGAITVAAEFNGHSIPSPQSVLSTEDFVVVEVGLFGPPDARLKLSDADFSLRINGKKTPLSAQPYAMVFSSLKDPEWAPPEPAESKSKTSIGSKADQSDPGAKPAPVHIPIEVERAMAQRVQKASLPEGERALPAAGLIFFKYGGKTKGIHSIELEYAGPAGKATLTLQP